MDNKRLYPRFSFTEPVGYQRGALVSNGSLADNISVGGLKLTAHEFIPLRTVLELQISLAHPLGTIQVKGKVVWIREFMSEDCYEVGLEFIKEEQSMRAIGEYLNARRFEST